MKFDHRKYVIITLFVLTGVAYVFKLFYMQVVDDHWKLRAQEIAEKKRKIKPPRAVMFDRTGKKVVENKTYYNLMMVEDEISDLDTLALAKLLGWGKQDVVNRFHEIILEADSSFNKQKGEIESNYRSYRAYPFMSELTPDEIARIAPYLDKFPGFYEEITSMRNYPFHSAANILGYLNLVNREEKSADSFYGYHDLVGRSGIERFYEKQLRGVKGVKYVVTSAKSQDIASFEGGIYDTTAVQASPLHLGLDIELQGYGEQLMQNKKGCIVAIEPSSGEILAMVSAPTYDPNMLVGRRKTNENYRSLLSDENKPLFPRPLASQYPPGSIFKIPQALIGMQEGVITKESGFPCTKSLVGCHNHGAASDVPKAIQYSCNPYFYYATRKIVHQHKKKNNFADAEHGLNRWAEYMNSFGFGVRLNSDISGIQSGRIPNSAYYDKWYGHHGWQFSTIYSIAIGQGEIGLTPLQMANLAAIVANKGWYYTPHFVKSIGENGPLDQFRVKNKTLVDAQHYEPIIEGMRRVVNEAGGTARRARISDITVCGKTGTVENFVRGVKQVNHSVFIAFAPMENPKIAIAVFIENAGFGGTWAAPTASLMIEKYLKGEISDEAKEKRILDAKLSNYK